MVDPEVRREPKPDHDANPTPEPDSKADIQPEIELKDLTKELYRVYEWIDPITGNRITHRISAPVSLYVGKTTHRILDSEGHVHFVPSVGYLGCVLYTMNRDASRPINF